MILDSQWIYRLLKTLIMAGGREREKKTHEVVFFSIFPSLLDLSLQFSPEAIIDGASIAAAFTCTSRPAMLLGRLGDASEVEPLLLPPPAAPFCGCG